MNKVANRATMEDKRYAFEVFRSKLDSGLRSIRLIEESNKSNLLRAISRALSLSPPGYNRKLDDLQAVVWLSVPMNSLNEEGRRNFKATCDAVFNTISEECHGKVLMVFDMSSEGRTFETSGRPWVNFLYHTLQELKIPAERAVWIQSNANFPADCLNYIANQGQIPIRLPIGNTWVPLMFAMAMNATSPPQRASYEFGFALQKSGLRKYRYICLNYLLRGHRLLLAAKLRTLKISGYLTISAIRSTYTHTSHDALKNEIRVLSQHSEVLSNISLAESLLNEKIDLCGDLPEGTPLVERILSLPVEEVSNSELFIVTESEMLGPDMSRFTEKILKAIVSGLPFIVFGNAGTIGMFRALGFDVLDDIIDHSYDNEPDPARRFILAWDSVQSFMERPQGFTEIELIRLRHANEVNRFAFASRLLPEFSLNPVLDILGMADDDLKA
jgi:hypothetical protein